MELRIICTKALEAAVERMLAVAVIMVRRSDCGIAHARLLSKSVRELTKIHLHNAMVKKKLYILSYQAGRDHVIRALGGERRLSSWERRKASEAARVAAAHRKRPPQWWLDKHHAKLRAEAARRATFARPDNYDPGIYIGTPEYGLYPLKRGPSVLRGCSLERRPARPPHGMNILPTLYFTPDELRAKTGDLPPAGVKSAPRKPARTSKPAPTPKRSPARSPRQNVVWEHISPQQARDEIFGVEPRASPG